MAIRRYPQQVLLAKKWGEYVLEFFMLFLAVFLGFLAENYREQQVERKMETEYMASLVKDLEMDSIEISRIIPLKEDRIRAIDSIYLFFKSNRTVNTISGKLFKTIRRTTWDRRFVRNVITINQLKNAGAMRLVHKKSIADSIATYEAACQGLEFYSDYYINNSLIGNEFSEELVNSADLLEYYLANETEAIVSNIPDTVKININRTRLSQQLNFMMRQKTFARQEINKLIALQQQIVRLRSLLKAEYL